MPFGAIGAAVGVASVGLGVAGRGAQQDAAGAQAIAQALDRESARQAAVLEFDKLDINIEERVRSAGAILGLANAAVAGAGAEVGSGLTAQARALTLTTLARDIEILRLNTDISTTRLGFGPDTGGPFTQEAIREAAVVAEKKAKAAGAAKAVSDLGERITGDRKQFERGAIRKQKGIPN